MYRRPVTSSRPGPDLDAARALVVERDLTVAAVGALNETVRSLPLDALAPVKQLLKRFFSDQAWTEVEDDALADAVGPGTDSGETRVDLAADLTLLWGWERGRFFLRVTHDWTAGPSTDRGTPAATPDTDLGLTFETNVFPEVTPSPRTIRFTTPPLHRGPSRVYNSSADAAGDPHAARIFREFDAVTNVLVGPAFVAVTISHPDHWETLLGPMLGAVAEEFTGIAPDSSVPAPSEPTPATDTSDADLVREPRRLERAWTELGALRADRPDDLDRILTASRDTEAAPRQVAAALLADASPDVAADGWGRLSGDSSRSVRRSTIDAVVDAHREGLRPLLERALDDPDAWIRWKAVRGIAALGVTPSRAVIEARASDPDFRVRLEATRTLAR
jgi:HEAT repeats/Scaffold protein Nfu/NifU N terminal